MSGIRALIINWVYHLGLFLVDISEELMKDIEAGILDKCKVEIESLTGRDDVEFQRTGYKEYYVLFRSLNNEYGIYHISCEKGGQVREIGDRHGLDIRFPYYYYPK